MTVSNSLRSSNVPGGLMIPAVLLVSVFSEPCPSNRREPVLASSRVSFLQEEREAQMIKARKLRINYTAGHFRAPKLGTKHFPFPTA